MPSLPGITSLIPASLDPVPGGQQQLPGGNGSDWEARSGFLGAVTRRGEERDEDLSASLISWEGVERG